MISEKQHRAAALKQVLGKPVPEESRHLVPQEPVAPDAPRYDLTAPPTHTELGAPPKSWEQMTGKEKDEQARRIFRKAFALPSLQLSFTNSQRALIAWRLTRAWARALLPVFDRDPEEPIEHVVFDVGYEIQQIPLEHFTGGLFRKDPYWKELRKSGKALTISPCHEDNDMDLWADVMQRLAREMNIGTHRKADEDKNGDELVRPTVRHMLDADHAKDAWPEARMIIVFEELMISQAKEYLVKSGAYKVEEWLTNRFGLMRQEVIEVMDMARQAVKDVSSDDKDVLRALLSAQLDALYEESVDDRVRLAILKQKTILHGLAQNEEDGDMADMLAAVRSTKSTDRVIDVPFTKE